MGLGAALRALFERVWQVRGDIGEAVARGMVDRDHASIFHHPRPKSVASVSTAAVPAPTRTAAQREAVETGAHRTPGHRTTTLVADDIREDPLAVQ